MTELMLLAFLWCSAWAARSLYRMTKGDISIGHPVLLVTYVFLALPLLYDLLLGSPDLSRFPGLHAAQNDEQTNAIFLAYVSFVFPTLYLVSTLRKRQVAIEPKSTEAFYLAPVLRAGCWMLVYLPLSLAFFSPTPQVYLQYAVSQGESFTVSVAEYHALISLSGRLAVLGAVALVLSASKVTPGLIILLVPGLTSTAWLVGKRSIIAMILAGLLLAFWQRGFLRGRKLLAVGLLALVSLGFFSASYQSSVRGERAIATSYEGFRIDYGRDSQTRLSIYANAHPDEVDILPEFGQTIPLYLGQLVPSSIWPSKPMPYAQYFTSAAFLAPPQLWGWGITTSWYEEWVSNIGRWGFVVAPLFLAVLCRWADRVRSALVRALLTTVLILLVVQHVSAFSFLIPMAGVLIVWERLSRRKSAQPPETPVVGGVSRIPRPLGAE